MSTPVFDGRTWWAQQADGSWLRWNEHAATWEPYGGELAAPPVPVSYPAYGAPVYPAYPPAYGPPARPRTNGFAIASLALAIPCLWWVGAGLGVIFGVIALRQIAESGGAETGRNLAIAGISVGAVWLGFLLVGFGQALLEVPT